ncbi:MAG: PA14 domain-containing protein, partial [Pseudomonadota bacterium]
DGIEIWDRLGDTAASDGDQLLELDHGRGLDSIEQIIQTQKGQLYDLALDVRERVADGTDTVEVYWNGNLIETLDPETADWQTFNLQVVGTGQDRLELRETDGQNDTYGALVDNITLSAAELTVAENTAGAIVGQIGFDDPDDGDTHRFDVSDDRFHVVDGQLALKPGVALDHAAASTLDIDVTVTDSGGLSETRTVSVRVAEQAEMHIDSGFHARYFDVDHRLSRLDDLDWTATPTHEEVVSKIDYAHSSEGFWDGGSTDTFGVHVSGNIHVEDDGKFTFFLGADDGAVLIIDGVAVIEDDGTHGFRTRSGEIELEPGAHAVEIRYFENHGRAGLKLEWEGPGLDGREPVTPPDVAEAQTVAGVPLTFDVDVNDLNLADTTRFWLDSLPEGTRVEANGETHVAGPDGLVELTGWTGELLTITPPNTFTGEVSAALHHSTPTGSGGTHNAVQTLSFDVTPAQLAVPDAVLTGGFHASYFDVDRTLNKLDDIDWAA